MKKQKLTTLTGLDWLVQMYNLKDKGLHKVSLFKNNFCKSWAYLPLTGQIVIHKDTPATNWELYKKEALKASYQGTGYKVKFYKRGQGVIGAEPNKPITKKAV